MEKKVAIVGGGLTGLVTALRLSQRGKTVVVLEKERQVGGLAGGFDWGKTSLERTYHHIFKSDEDIVKLIEELDLKDKLEWKKSSVAQYHEGRFYPFVTAMDLLRFGPLGLVDKVRLGSVYIYLQKLSNWKNLSGVGAADWMKKWAGKTNYEIIWQPLLQGKFHQYYKKVSMAWLWGRIHVRAQSKNNKTGEELGYLMGGFQLIIDGLVEKIKENGGMIKVNCRVREIRKKGSRIEVKWGNEKISFDRVVACVPAGIFSKITGIKSKKAKEISYLGFINVVFRSKQNLSPYYWHNIGDNKSPFLAFIQHTNLVDKKNYQNKHLYYLGAYVPQNHKYLKEEEANIYKEFFAYLKKIFPAFKESLVEKKEIFRFDWAQHLADVNYEKKIPGYKSGIDGVYFANFCQIFPYDRGMNYAVIEGEKVAKMVV